MKITLFLVQIIFLTSCLYCSNVNDCYIRDGVEKSILILGDSRAELNFGWNQLRFFIVNCGCSGKTTVYILSNEVPEAYGITKSFDMVFIFAGVNDTDISPYVFQSNLTTIINFYKNQNIPVVLMDITLNATFPTMEAYEINRQIMQSFPEYLPIDYLPEHFVDAGHLSQSGYEFVSGIMNTIIEE